MPRKTSVPIPKKAPRKPRTPSPKVEARRKRVIVESVTKTAAEVALEEGITRQHASRIANTPQGRVEIATLIDEHYADAASAVTLAFQSIADAFAAEKKAVTKEGEVIDLGPDHFVRLTAVKRLIELLTAGRTVPKLPQEGGSTGMSLEDLTTWAEQFLSTKPR